MHEMWTSIGKCSISEESGFEGERGRKWNGLPFTHDILSYLVWEKGATTLFTCTNSKADAALLLSQRNCQIYNCEEHLKE